MHGSSSLSGYNFGRAQNNSSSKSKGSHLAYLAIISVLLAVVFFSFLNGTSSDSSGKLAELEAKV